MYINRMEYVCNFPESGSRENGFRMGLRGRFIYKELLTYLRAIILGVLE